MCPIKLSLWSLCPLWGFFAELAPLPPAGRQSCLHWGRSQAGPGLSHAVVTVIALFCFQAAQGGYNAFMGILVSLEGVGEAGTPLSLLGSSPLRSEVEAHFSRRVVGEGNDCQSLPNVRQSKQRSFQHSAHSSDCPPGEGRGLQLRLCFGVCFWRSPALAAGPHHPKSDSSDPLSPQTGTFRHRTVA